jgi:hypothetical protein
MATPKGIAKLELAEGEKNKKGITLKTNRFKVEGDISGTIYMKDAPFKSCEISIKPLA